MSRSTRLPDDEVDAITRKVARRTLALVEGIDESVENVVDESADPYASSVQESLRKISLTLVDDPPIRRGRRAAFLRGLRRHHRLCATSTLDQSPIAMSILLLNKFTVPESVSRAFGR